ncbi:hemolysin family protein [Geothrix fermentans]|jgi:CBS domain containing-hemolysin-like protein|uniref:hemolysin family protein n=1 Tax=Geothrix fermentans TaxID=44676 RepID=UPI00040BABBB|nr:hemolysin family protein [Geothrix fermentans]
MADPGGSAPPSWLLLAALALLLYRGTTVALLSAFHALPSLQRRRLLEEDTVRDPQLAALLERPRTLGMGLEFWNKGLLLILLGLLWPFRLALPGGGWSLGLLVLAGLWFLDLALPALLTSGDPGAWLIRLFPLYAPVRPLLAPLVDPIARLIDRHTQERAKEAEPEEATEEAVTALLEEGEAEGILEAGDRELIRNVVTFRDILVREVMTPRTRIAALSLDASIPEAWQAFTRTRHSRLPIFEGSIDHIRGVLLLKDLIQLPDGDRPPLSTLMKPARFVPESKPVMDLLREMQRTRTQLAIVVDEFGGLSGLASMEDLLEEIFGEIQDEHEAPAGLVVQAPGVYVVSGQAHVDDVAQRLELTWERDGFDTLAGLVLARLGRVPRPQESVDVEGARLTVLKMEGTRIVQVRIERT